MTVGCLTSSYGIYSYRLFGGLFNDKLIPCGDGVGRVPLNGTVGGIEKVFVLDRLFSQKFSFSQAKMIDTSWDILVGRGVQLLAWWAAYVVFSDALLHMIERHPASFRIFQRIALEGPSLLAVWTLAKEVWAAKSKRTRALFFYIFLSTSYILWIPLLLSAMTGYNPSTITWINLDSTTNLAPASALQYHTWVILGANNTTFEKSVCGDESLLDEFKALREARIKKCVS